MTLKKIALAALLICGMPFCASAQETQDDPVIMVINGKPVLRSEYEYSYNKNNGDDVLDRKTVEEYVDLFVNYRLKVEAALEARLDTLESYNREFRQCRDLQVKPTIITDADIEAEAQRIYNATKDRIGPDGLVYTSHILIRVLQNADDDDAKAAEVLADSIWNALQGGANFEELAKAKSQDPGSAARGGELGWVQRGMMVQPFEDAVFSLKDGEMSKPVKTDFGYHIIKVRERKQFEPYEFHREAILAFIEKQKLRERITATRLTAIAQASGITEEQVMDMRSDSIAAIDMNMRYLIQEYHDGLLMFEISNREVWEKASKDEEGLMAFYKKNKKKYTWDSPRFKGISYCTREVADVEAVKKSVKGKPFSEWVGILRTTFNNDSILRIRVEKGIFKKGDNGLVDREVFGVADAKIKEYKDFPNRTVFGKLLKAPEEMGDVRALVVADYQDVMEKEWVKGLRAKYPVVVNREVLATVRGK